MKSRIDMHAMKRVESNEWSWFERVALQTTSRFPLPEVSTIMEKTIRVAEVGERELYQPSLEIAANANVKEYDELYRRSMQDPQSFWAERAAELDWFRPWDQVLDDSTPPFFKWFVGGKTNIVYNCLDRHLKTFRKNKEALIWVGENGEERAFSYFSLHRIVCKFANVLKSLGSQER